MSLERRKLTKDSMKDTEVITASNSTKDLLPKDPCCLFSLAAKAERRKARDVHIPAPRMLGIASELPEKKKCRRDAIPAASPSPPLTVVRKG